MTRRRAQQCVLTRATSDVEHLASEPAVGECLGQHRLGRPDVPGRSRAKHGPARVDRLEPERVGILDGRADSAEPAGDPQGDFADFCEATMPTTLLVARRACGSRHVADDATQEAYVVMLASWPDRCGRAVMDNQRYVIKIALHKVVDWSAAWHRDAGVGGRSGDEGGAGDAAALVDHDHLGHLHVGAAAGGAGGG
ncbi:hypothetical protein [Kutzneria sp. NPDC052558]|uniref:hypothetical protein n=1 Tax=Kutzneria sp. NPDC052558 TaxID=3364121 RepID=UPI0037CB734C